MKWVIVNKAALFYIRKRIISSKKKKWPSKWSFFFSFKITINQSNWLENYLYCSIFKLINVVTTVLGASRYIKEA